MNSEIVEVWKMGLVRKAVAAFLDPNVISDNDLWCITGRSREEHQATLATFQDADYPTKAQIGLVRATVHQLCGFPHHAESYILKTYGFASRDDLEPLSERFRAWRFLYDGVTFKKRFQPMLDRCVETGLLRNAHWVQKDMDEGASGGVALALSRFLQGNDAFREGFDANDVDYLAEIVEQSLLLDMGIPKPWSL